MTAGRWLAVLLAGLAGATLVPRPTPGSRRRTAQAAGRRGGRRGGSRKQAAALQAALVELLGALGGEVGSGAEPRAALAAAAGDQPLLAEVVAAARSPDGDVAAKLHGLGARPGGALARDLAIVWAVADRTGASLAVPVARLFAAAREDERVRRELAAQLAGPRATARLLAGLPVLGLAIGASLGAQPARFLLATAPGRACLLIGAALLMVGLRWSRAIHRQAAAGLG